MKFPDLYDSEDKRQTSCLIKTNGPEHKETAVLSKQDLKQGTKENVLLHIFCPSLSSSCIFFWGGG